MWLSTVLYRTSVFFHSLPRLNFRFQDGKSDAGFCSDYFQALVLWACVPVLICIILLVVIFIAWSVKCSPKKSSTKQNARYASNASANCLLVVVATCCSSLFACLLANEMANRGITNACIAVQLYHRRTHDTVKKIDSINETLYGRVANDLELLKSGLQNLRSLQQKYLGADSWVLRITEIKNEIANASRHLESVNSAMEDFSLFFTHLENMRRYEFERRILFGSLYTIILIVMIPALTVVSVQSRRGLIIFGALALFIFIICWCLVGATTAFNILLSDVCRTPITMLIPFLTNDLSRGYVLDRFVNNLNDSKIFSALNPLQQELQYVQASVEHVPAIMNGISCSLGQSAGETSASVVQVLSLCQQIQRDFYDALERLAVVSDFVDVSTDIEDISFLDNEICRLTSLSAFILLCGTLFSASLLFLILLALNRAWRCRGQGTNGVSTGRYVGAGSCDVDDLYVSGGVSADADPFLLANHDEGIVPAEFYGTHISNPRANQRRAIGQPEPSSRISETISGNGIWRATPPPAYECVPLLRSQTRQQRL